jgi:uncharacterized protein (TIGR02453 family)
VTRAESGTAPFAGLPDEAFLFYEGLEADNSKAYWQAHKAAYEQHVRAPVEALVTALETEFGHAKLFRPYRDVRFSHDKSPYKTHQGAFVEVEPGIGYYVQVAADGVTAAAGFHAHAPDQVARYRAAVDDEATGTRLATTVAELADDGFAIGGDVLKTRPRGVDPGHPRLALLRHKSLTAARAWPPEPWVHTPQAYDAVAESWRATVPLVEWLARHVGPTREPRR